jgi:hypothetical protein
VLPARICCSVSSSTDSPCGQQLLLRDLLHEAVACPGLVPGPGLPLISAAVNML